jgi:signal transduction histidine kinase/serine phosphatase RsbU (regulator of sigma subunit)/FixJ family two-component response regulator
VSGVLPADLKAAAALGGEMGQRLLSFDWAGHPLGSPAGWPAAMRATIAAALASRFPIVLWFGPELRLIYNDAYIPVLGDKHPAALGRPGAEVWWDIWDVAGPLMDSVVGSGIATWSDDLMLMLVNDGRRQERYFTFTYSPILGEAGEMTGVFCAVAETTERVLSERRLRTLNALAAALLDAQSPDSVLAAAVEVCAAHDADLPFAAVYLADGPLTTGRAHRATPGAAGLLPQSLAPLLDAASADGDGLCVLTGLRSLLPELASRFGDRGPEQALVIPVSTSAGGAPAEVLLLGLNPDRPLDQQYQGFCRLLADQVSAALAGARAYEAERRRAELLAELDRAKTAFLTNVSHEFRTPLTLMLGPLEDLVTAARDDPGTRGHLEIVRRNGLRLLRLVNSLLDFSRIEAGKAAPRLAVADLGGLTGGVASSFAHACRLAGLDLILDCRPVWAEADPGMWEIIVANLISNAIKYTFTGSVTVRAGPGGDGGVELTVADTGTGIAAEDLPHLFERFYRAGTARARTAEGVGIGLALVKGHVEMHDGTISVDSAPGAGTTVTVRLPPARVRTPGAPDPAAGGLPPAAYGNAYAEEALQWAGPLAAAAGPGPGESGRPLVLVADDNADMRAYLTRVLGQRFSVLAASDGGHVLELARRHRPDLLLTDVMMPGLDGFALTAAIRADPELAPLPVIMLSARAGIEAVGDGLTVGADDYLVKPFSSADLVNRVAARLEAAGRDRARGRHDEAAASRGLALAALGTALSAARSVEEALDALLAVPLCSVAAAGAGAGLLDAGRGHLRVTYRGRMRAEAVDRYHVIGLDAPVPLADVARTGRVMVVPDTARLDPLYAQVAADAGPDTRASIMHPLRAADGSVIGGVGLSWPEPREFSLADVEVTARAAAMLGQTVARITAVQREHQVAMALQERLLDPGKGASAAVTAAAYQPAAEAMRVGGDWYTVTPLGPGRVGISVGDVAGHGLDAAATMMQLRSALSAAALASDDPAVVLDVVDRHARGLPEAAFATAVYAIADAGAGTVEYTSAGHPYPLVVTIDGDTRYLTGSRRTPLAAVSPAAAVPGARGDLPPGSLLILYTDGLIERRGESLDAGFARLAEAAASCARRPAGAVCAALLERMAGPGGYADDVAIAAVRPAGTTPGCHVDALPASFAEMPGARERLRGWLEGLVPGPGADPILLAAGEALANAIEHGSGSDPDRIVGIEAFADAGAITVTVSDSGRWAKDSAASRSVGRGQGLTVIHGLAGNVRTVRGPHGTRVTLTWRADGRAATARRRPPS